MNLKYRSLEIYILNKFKWKTNDIILNETIVKRWFINDANSFELFAS